MTELQKKIQAIRTDWYWFWGYITLNEEEQDLHIEIEEKMDKFLELVEKNRETKQ